MTSPFSHPWWSPFSGIGEDPKCKDEWLIIEISNNIRLKPQWKAKYKDPIIAAKWKQEIREFFEDKTKLIDDVINYVFAELEWYDNTERDFPGLKDKGFAVGCDLSIVYSDSAIDSKVKLDFKENVQKLVDSFGDDLDYHPGSENKVIDLVHPSLFPLQYGITPIYTDDKKSNVKIVEYSQAIQNVKKYVTSDGVSERFQWLPALLRYNQDLKKYEFKSYINNLHPEKHVALYNSIESIFNSVLPGLNFTLSSFASKSHIRIEIPQYNDAYLPEYEKKLNEAFEDVEFSDEAWEELEASRYKYLKTFTPEFKGGPVFDKTIDLEKDFNRLKVIVKLANIELTPENPSYSGGSWHVEGAINEDIVATVLYYYDTVNISESKLKFRTAFEDPKYEQGDENYGTEIFGIKDGDPMTREIGNVIAIEDRVAIFPNTFQHQVDSFDLADKTKKGHRKILCFFIVDPYNDLVVTTDQVPPQQQEWWNDGLVSDEVKKSILAIKDKSPWPQTLDEAKRIREELMKERSAATEETDEYDDGAFRRTFSLCEH